MGAIKTKDLLPIWRKERDEAALSFDVETFRRFYEKWHRRGFYDIPLPADDRVIEIAIREMVLGLANPPEDKKKEARDWLEANGYDPDPWKEKT